MKKQITLFCALALAAGGFAALVGRTKAYQPVRAAESTSTKSIVIYERDFNNMSGTNADELWAEDQLFWFNPIVSPSIQTVNGRKGLEMASVSNGAIGGIGSGATTNLSKLVQGQRYRVSFYFEMNAAAENAAFFMEPQDTNWTGLKILKDDLHVQNWQTTFNVQVHDNQFSFEFVPAKATNELYFALFTENFAPGEKLFIDDFKIEAVDTIWGSNWRNEAIGADDAANGDIEKIYGVEWGPTTVVTKGEGYERYVKWATPGYTPGNDNYVKFYLNNFGALPLKDRTVRIELDFELAVGSTDLVYVSANYYDPNGIVGIDIWAPYENVTGSGIFNYLSFKDPGKVIVEFTPTVDFAPDAWGDFFYFTFKMGDQLLEAHVTSVAVSYVDGNVAKAGAIIDLIKAIGTVDASDACKDKIVAAEGAYAAADDSVKGLVNNYEVLTAARKAYDDAVAAAAAAAELAAAKTTAKTELESYKSASDYREAEQGQLATIVSEGKTAIDAATDKAGVTAALNEAKGKADALKTKAQYEAEEAAAQLAAKKERAVTAITNYYNTLAESGKYTEANLALLLKAKDDCIVAINAATTVEEVNAAVTAGQAALEAVEQKQEPQPQPEPEPQPEPQPQPQPEKKGGCGGSVVAASALISTLALAGFGLLISRKRKQD